MTALDKFTPDDFAKDAHDAYEWDDWTAIWDAAHGLEPIADALDDMRRVQDAFNASLEDKLCGREPACSHIGDAQEMARESVIAILRYRRCEVDAKTVKRSLERLGAHYAACLGS